MSLKSYILKLDRKGNLKIEEKYVGKFMQGIQLTNFLVLKLNETI